jgi:type II secretory pathway component PulK
MICSSKPRRSGIALLWALATILLLLAVMAATTAKITAERRLLVQRQHQLQSQWLARSGLEIAVSRLQSDLKYRGEKIQILAFSELEIKVTAVEDEKDVYEIHVQARYPTDAIAPVLTQETRRMQTR